MKDDSLIGLMAIDVLRDDLITVMTTLGHTLSGIHCMRLIWYTSMEPPAFLALIFHYVHAGRVDYNDIAVTPLMQLVQPCSFNNSCTWQHALPIQLKITFSLHSRAFHSTEHTS